MDAAYEALAAALDRLANGFPRTSSGVELRMLRMMFSPEEAALASVLTSAPATLSTLARRSGLKQARTAHSLGRLVERDAVWVSEDESGTTRYRLAPFLPGSFDMHLLITKDAEYARLAEEYLGGGGGALMMAPQPAIHRVVPARAAIKSEWVLPYDDVRALLLGAEAFRVKECVCRLQAELAGARRCTFPLENCLWFASTPTTAAEGDTVSRTEALALLDEAERVGLVHTVSNAVEGGGYICNCCGCCCHLLRGITDWGIENSVAQANYYAEIDARACPAGCNICARRCQVRAISRRGGAFEVERNRCLGCGLCVSGCPSKAAQLCLRPEGEIVPPPADYEAWERERLRSRGL